ncbi:hypothetical protein HYPSUDRAFT_526272 [Hypholoma sublateritium FD-334 SS-4]|uniref:F-box domain-containing protein n=1 Tax=Hypholoma sublateritium (strain FD-334 SS-4) TaxID=945553 RepID=A0A0D2MKT1_HYPSF|nr:hypothetical protein HYPSUDRAFT_526272 [Hypholoma sublateritium FD-334 SS-4]
MTAELPARPIPITELGSDVLYEIFLANTYREIGSIPKDATQFDLSHSPLTITRRTSQVCRMWRDIILQSPLIWARCIDLDCLDQKTNNWRQLVLQRTAETMLCITAVSATRRMVPERHGLATFFARLLDERWERIAEIDISIHVEDLKDNRITVPFNQPTNSLRVFEVRTIKRRSAFIDLPLFSGHAPSLVRISLPEFPSFQLDVQSTSMFTSCLRHITLDQPILLVAYDFLNAFLRTPLLETLKMNISNVIYETSESHLLPRPTMSRLTSIHVICPTLDIYPAFLDRLTAEVGCALRMIHHLHGNDEFPESLESMQRIFQRYADSFFKCHQGPDQETINDVGLHVSPFHCLFSCYKERFEVLVGRSGSNGRFQNLPPSIIARLLDTVSMLNIPDTVRQLKLNVNLKYAVSQDVISGFSPSLFEALKAMDWVTCLVISFTDNSTTLKELCTAGNDALFPALKTLSLIFLIRSPQVKYTNFEETILKFCSRRNQSSPVEYLRLETFGQSPWIDMRALDELNGLTVVWDADGAVNQYSCGSGDTECLLFGRGRSDNLSA